MVNKILKDKNQEIILNFVMINMMKSYLLLIHLNISWLRTNKHYHYSFKNKKTNRDNY